MTWREPDKLEYGLRFGCGAILGMVLAVVVLVQIIPEHSWTILLGSLVAAIIFGILSMRRFLEVMEWVKRWGF